MTGPVAGLVDVLLNAMGPQNETAVFLGEERKADVLRGVFNSYYRPQAACDVIFDTNRSWCARLPTLKALFPEAKVLCCVRNVAWNLRQFRAARSQERLRAFASVRIAAGAAHGVFPGRGARPPRPGGWAGVVGP